jgi:hypothetical protein
VTATQRQVNIADRMWARLLSSTNQPDFLRYKKAMQELRKQNALKQAEKIESDVAAHNSNSAPTSSSSPSAGNGNGSSKSAHKETLKIETGDRQYTPVEKEEMLLMTPVPGDPTKIHNHTAP